MSDQRYRVRLPNGQRSKRYLRDALLRLIDEDRVPAGSSIESDGTSKHWTVEGFLEDGPSAFADAAAADVPASARTRSRAGVAPNRVVALVRNVSIAIAFVTLIAVLGFFMNCPQLQRLTALATSLTCCLSSAIIANRWVSWRIALLGAMATFIFVWSLLYHYSWERVRWSSERFGEELSYIDYYQGWGSPRLWKRSIYTTRDGKLWSVCNCEMAGDSEPTLHGVCETLVFHPEYDQRREYYWYGEPVSRGDWEERRSR